MAAISGPHQALIERVEPVVREISDPGLLKFPVTAVDVFVTNKAINGKTLRELADLPWARGIYLRRITRNLVEIPDSAGNGNPARRRPDDRGQHSPRRRRRRRRWATRIDRWRRRI